MTSPRKPGFVLPVAVTLAVLLGLYVGAYYAMVDRIPEGLFGSRYGPLYYVGDFDQSRWWNTDKDQAAPGWERFFRPIHWLDRRIRPHFWGLTRTEEFAPAP